MSRFALHFRRLIEEFHDPAIFAVFDCVFRLCDEVGCSILALMGTDFKSRGVAVL